MNRKKERTRLFALSAVVLAPTMVLTWIGCSSDPENTGTTGPRVNVDPGGTFGAEISLKVIGRGRVVTDLPGLDCPTDCFSRIVFRERTEKGADGTIKLKAIPTVGGTRFAGWKFETAALGVRGKGPDECNPVMRDGTLPSVDMNAPEIALPYGEVNGAPPKGQEGTCGAFTTVPTLYNVVATFVDDTIGDGGDGGDADGGPGEVLYESAMAGAQAREIGIVASRLYWKFVSGASHGIATGLTLTTPNATPQVAVPATGPIDRFESDAFVVIQKSGGELSFFNGGASPTVLPNAPLSCNEMTSDLSAIYCQSADTLSSWTTGAVGPTVLYTGLPAGADRLAADNTYLYFVDNSQGAGLSTISRTSRAGNDGGAATLTTLLSNQTNPIRLKVGSSRTYWINYDGVNIIGEGRTASTGSSIATINAPAQSGMRFLTPDPSNTSVAYIGVVPVGNANDSKILRVGTSSGSMTVFRSGISSLGGIAVDSSYVYWTASDGRVYRAIKQ